MILPRWTPSIVDREEGGNVRIALLVLLGVALLIEPLGLVVGTVSAGPSGGGLIIVHANDAYASVIDSALQTDLITGFGRVHWYEADSTADLVTPTTGACCLSNTTCQLVNSTSECTNLLGVYQGDNTICERPCSACCYWQVDPPTRSCVVTTETDCTTGSWSEQLADDGFGHLVGSTWSGVKEGGVGHECATSPSQAATQWFCQDPREGFPAAKPATWGHLKAVYR
jgi:hypothetical protein